MILEINLEEIYKWLKNYYQKTHPELIPMLAQRYQYATGPYPPAMKAWNRTWLMTEYLRLKRWARVER